MVVWVTRWRGESLRRCAPALRPIGAWYSKHSQRDCEVPGPSRPVSTSSADPSVWTAAGGCYRFARHRWHRVDCASATYLRRHLRHLELEDGIQSATLMLGPGPGAAPAPFVYGQIGLEFTQVGTEKDSAVGKNAFSIQDNTTFTGSNGHYDGVQFADQSRPGGSDAVCVWTWTSRSRSTRRSASSHRSFIAASSRATIR
jgi:hypothetical protein